jgi:phosphonate transport system permease protein
MKPRFRFPKRRVGAVATDWAAWLYISYCVFYLVNHWYVELVAVRPYDRLNFPSYGWPLTIIASFLIVVAWQNLGISVGLKMFGLVLVREDKSVLSRGQRIGRVLIDLVSWMMTLGAAGLFVVPLVGFGTLLYGLVTRVGISFIPGVVIWGIGPWYWCLLQVLLSMSVLGATGVACWFATNRLMTWLWPSSGGAQSWCDRVLHTQIIPITELEETGVPPRRWFKTSWGFVTVLLLVMTFYVGWLVTDVDFGNLIKRAPTTVTLWQRLLHPDLEHFLTEEPILKDSIGTALLETIFMAFLATVVGVVFAFPMSFLGARNIMATGPIGWAVYSITRAFFNVFRSVETIIWAIVFAVWVSFGPFAGVLALAMHTIAALGKLYSEQVESIDPGPLEAIAATGASRWQVVIYGVIPQVIPSYLAFTMYRWDINVRMSTVIGLVGGGGIGRMLFFYKGELMWEQVGTIIISIVAVVWTMDYISARVRERVA